jgi:hypothetical protein
MEEIGWRYYSLSIQAGNDALPVQGCDGHCHVGEADGETLLPAYDGVVAVVSFNGKAGATPFRQTL